MNRKDIIRMAQEADPFGDAGRLYVMAQLAPETLERFAALVASAERNRTWTQDHWTEYERAIVTQEREACAKLCDDKGMFHEVSQGADLAFELAAAIRARGQA